MVYLGSTWQRRLSGDPMQLTGSWHHTGLVPDPSRGKGQALGLGLHPPR